MFWNKSKPKLDEMRYAIDSIRDFINGTGGDWDWDDFISPTMKDPEAARIQGICRGLRHNYPPGGKTGWCNAEGIERLKQLLAELEQKQG